MSSSSLLRIPLCLGLCLGAVLAPLEVDADGDHSASSTLSLADLQQLVAEHGRIIRSLRVEGVVCAVIPKRRLVALQDKSATVLLELPVIEANVRVGDRLAIEGKDCSLTQGDVSVLVDSAPVVNNDGHHPSRLRTGKAFLSAGLQPVQLAWFNGVADAALKLEWEGPGLGRQTVPGAVLWRKASAPSTTNGMEPGLDYVARNGEGYLLADFENQESVFQGVATNFCVSYRVRPEHTALFFSGFINVPASGVYTFYLSSDDGARLNVGERHVSCTRIPVAGISLPQTRTLNQALRAPSGSSWIEQEGTVTFAGVNREHLSIDLVADGSRIPVTVVGGAKMLSTNLLNEHIVVKGICEFSLDEKKMARIIVPGPEQIEILDSEMERAGEHSTNLLLTSVSQVRQLKPEQVKQRIPARIRGVLVGIRDIALMLQDSTGGISVRYTAQDWIDQPHLGDMLEVEGVIGPGLFAPVMMESKVRRLGTAPMPEPIHPRWDQLINGSLDCVYVEMQGIVIAASGKDLTLFSADGTVTVDLDGNGIDNFLSLMPRFATNEASIVGSLVRLRGCCMPDTDQKARHVIAGRIHLNSPLLTVEEVAPSDPFSLPTKKIAELLWFDPRASALQRTKLKGQILHAQTGEYLALEGQRGFRILTSRPSSLEAGDIIEAVGFPKLDGASPILLEAQIQKVGHDPLPAPVPVSADGLLDRNHDSTLIQVEAVLVGESTHSHMHILEMQAGPRHFMATQESVPYSTRRLAVGSRLQLVGVCASGRANRAETSNEPFSLLLIDGAGAIKVLEWPSWWTAAHALILAGVLASALGIAFVWITLLRYKVKVRTNQLRVEIQERQRVEKDQAVEQERMRVAKDLHDELGAGLTTVGLLGALVKNPVTPPDKRAGYVDQITDSAHSLVTALDEIVWAVNPQNDSLASSANYYAYFAQPFLNAAGIACRLEIEDSFSEHPLDPRIRHGVFLAFKEALNNVVRHSGATEVTVKILTADNQLIITITDNGHGIAKAGNQAGPGQDGMVGMRDRLSHFGGSCLITTQEGRGTTVEFRIPVPPPSSARGAGVAHEVRTAATEDEP